MTVKATSPAQIGALTAVTNEEGIYRFPAVPPGEYRLEFGLSGFRTLVREGIRVTLGFNAAVTVTLGVATRAGDRHGLRRVSGGRPIDDTAADQLRPRDACIAAEREGHVVAARRDTVDRARRRRRRRQHRRHADDYFAYGYFGQNRPLIEGINTTEGTSAAGFYLDYGSFEEVFIGAAGNSAEMPNPGVLTQFVGRSGGNRLPRICTTTTRTRISRAGTFRRRRRFRLRCQIRPDGNVGQLQEPQSQRRRSDRQRQGSGATSPT